MMTMITSSKLLLNPMRSRVTSYLQQHGKSQPSIPMFRLTDSQARPGFVSTANSFQTRQPSFVRGGALPTVWMMNRSAALVASSFRSSRILGSSLCPLSFHAGSVSYFSSQIGGGGGRRPPPGGGGGWIRGAGMLGASAVVLAGKGKYLLGALKLTKLASLGSMVLTIGTYSMFFGVPYAVGMVGLITVHEIGHILVMLQRGIPFSPMVFMPFVGAAIAMNRRPRDAWEDALVAFGGPVLGTVGAGGVAIAAQMTDSQLLFALADFGYMINLFNLIPIGSMDGGRIAGALSKWTQVVGLGMGGTLVYTGAVSNPIIYLVLLAGGWETFQRFYNPQSLPPNYYKITQPQRFAIGLSYAGLIGAILLAMDMNKRHQKPPEVLMRERELEKTWVIDE